MSYKKNTVLDTSSEDVKEKMQADESSEQLLTVREVARRLRVDDTTVRRWIKSSALEAIALPHRGKRQAYRIKKATLDMLFSNEIPLSQNV